MDYYEENLKDAVEITKSRKINELIVEYGIEKTDAYKTTDWDAKIFETY